MDMDMDDTIITELSPEQLQDLKSKSDPQNIYIVKFGATWCGPCQKIKQLCENYFFNINKRYKNITCFDIDVDESIELYMLLKRKKMLNGLPTILAYYGGGDNEHWYVPNDSVVGANDALVTQFFERCIEKSNTSTTSNSLVNKMANTNI